MSLLDSIITQTAKRPIFAVIYGGPGVGKSTLAAGMPEPLMFDFDQGADQIEGLARIDMADHDYVDYMDTLYDIEADPQNIGTLIIDTEDKLFPKREQALLDELKIDHLSAAPFGKAYQQLREIHSAEINLLKKIRKKGVHIIILCHAQIKTINEPHLIGDYQLYTLNIPDKHTALLFEAADLIGYAHIKTVIKKGAGGNSASGMVTGERELVITPHTGIHAKNRYGAKDNIPLSADALLNLLK